MADDTQRTDPNDVEALRSYHGAPPLSRDVVLGILDPLAERIRALGEGNLDCGCSTAFSQEHITVSTCDEHGGWKATVRERRHPEITGVVSVPDELAKGLRALCEGKLDCGCETTIGPKLVAITLCSDHGGWRGNIRWRLHPEITGATPALTYADGKRVKVGDTFTDGARSPDPVINSVYPEHAISRYGVWWTREQLAQCRLLHRLEKNSFHHDGGGKRSCEPAQNLTGENGTNVNHDTIEQRLRNRRDRLERQYDDVQARLTALDHDQEQRDREYRAAHGELTDDLRRIEAQRELVDAILAGTEGDEG